MPSPAKTSRVVVHLDLTHHRQLKAKLASHGRTVASWLREKVRAEIGAKA